VDTRGGTLGGEADEGGNEGREGTGWVPRMYSLEQVGQNSRLLLPWSSEILSYITESGIVVCVSGRGEG
jgi:hypothetical protein